jgi:Fe-Mn family superoxide dismutase
MAVKTAPYQAKDYSGLLGTRGFSDTLLKNHFTLYQGYVANTNKLLEMISELPKDGKNPDFAELSRRLGFEWNGMRLHEYYFEQIGGNGKIGRSGKLHRKLSEEFGGFEDWEKSFRAVGGIKGVGWAALYHDPVTGRCINFWINEHHVSHPAGCQLLLVMDAWEHAFMTDYGLNRAGYIDAFMQALNWDIVEQRLVQ